MNIKSPKQTEKELKEFWKIDDLKFTAQFAINKQGKGYFRNIRKQDGNICFFPDNSRVNIPASNIDLLEPDREYLITAFVAPEAKRKELGIEYLLYLDTKFNPPRINQQSPKQYVQKLYNQYQAAEGILKDSLSGAIRRLAVETNKKAEAFIYEILQNADDYPDPVRKKVNIRFKILDNYLIVTHNGQPFKENNVYAICSVATGDKERDLNKTGYKGIGFKSIFKHSNYVWIHSGTFSFRFDEDYHRRKGNQTFWQLIPIWTDVEAVDKVVCTPDIINAAVSIVIRPKDGLSRLNEYANIFEKVFQDERVLLFLRSVESLTFQRNDLSFTKAKSKDSWEISDLPEFEVPTELQWRINQVIDRRGDDRVPEKFKDIEKTKITFATAKKGGKLVATENTRIYAYLPTDLNFGLPFLINGDFIPDGSREKLFWDLDWNKFLFKQAGNALVEWIQKLYIKYKDASALILMPDISRLISEDLDESKREYLQFFAEGIECGIKNIALIPDTKGNLQLLNDLVIDLTGLFDIMGEDAFRKCTEIEEPIMHSSFASVAIIDGLMITYELGKEFSKDGLLDILTNDDFLEWLKKAENNVRFLNLLKTKGWLDEFRERSIFLNEDGELDDANSVYYDLGDDAHLIDWMGIHRLHQRVKKAFKPTEVPTLIYEPQFFIDNFILKYKSEIDAKLDDPVVNVNFYQYLFKHNENLTNSKFENGQLGYFKILGYNGCIINSVNSESVYLVNNDLEKLIENNSLTADHIALIDPDLFAEVNKLENWKTFFKRFGVKEFTDATIETFISDEIVSREEEIFKHFELSGNEEEDCTLQKGNIAFWIFLNSALNHIAKAKEKEFKESISQLPIYSKNEDQLYPLNECYLPKEYTGNETLERLLEQHSDIQIQFVSDLYLTHKELSIDKWNLLFQTFYVKTDVKDLLLHYLIPEINELSEENLIAVTRLIFENRSFLKEKISTLNLKLKTACGCWLPATETMIGRHYSGSELEDQILPSLNIHNTISKEYSSIALKKWYEFFKGLGAIEYQSEQDVISEKIKSYFEDEEQLNENNAGFTFLFVKDLVDLNEAEKLSDKHCESLSSMQLLLKGDGSLHNYEVASKCHFASEYKPKLDLDGIIPIDQKPDIFVSDRYIQKCGAVKDVKAFFKKIGVKEDFYIVRSDVKARKELEPSFVSFIDNSNSKIKSNALSWASQHKIKPWLELPYLAYLNTFPASVLFWEKIASNEKFLKSTFESLQYHYYFPTVAIPNYIEWFIKNTASIPARDGKCYKASELYSTKLEKFVTNTSLLPKIDLKNIKYADKSLEEYLGFKMKLTLDLCLNRFIKLKDVNQLKKEGTWEIFIQLLEEYKLSEDEKRSLKEFVQAGFLPNQLNVWKALNELYFIQDDFDLDVGNSPCLIHDELSPVAIHLGIKGLTTIDFNPEIIDVKNENFKEILTSRSNFIALAEKPADWMAKASELCELIEPISFASTRRISFSYRDVDPAIENTEKTFYEHNRVVYYVGNWKGARASELFYFIHQLLKLEHISVKVLQDLLLLSEAEVLNFFEEKNIGYPDAWKPHEPGLKEDEKPHNGLAVNTQSRNNDEMEKSPKTEKMAELTDEEIAELEALLNRQLSSSEMANTLIIALYRALKHYEASGYDVTATKANIDECIRKRMLVGVVRIGTNDLITVLVRSAKKGILHLNYQAWSDLNNNNTELFVVTGNSSTDYLLFPDQKCLSSINKDSWVAKIGGDDKYGELSSLLNGEYLNPDKKFAPLQFLIRIKENGKYQSIFERIYSIEKFPEFDQLD